MAKETKAERTARGAQENLDYQQMTKAAYPLRLMRALERVTGRGTWGIMVMNLRFRIIGPDDGQIWDVDYDYHGCDADIESLENGLDAADAADAAREKYYAVCNAALDKLTPEERDAVAKMFGAIEKG
jgi:hypothetical protein